MGKKLKYIVGILIIGVLLFFVFLRITKPKEEVEAKALPTVTTI
ncbi:MAG: efflux RND transporter periplasmic adaptor subunit, partial [Oribacterium parvum]|nr:efflux RND transporter periplasmic adaptor subunit [Oribacterium parvum]